VAFLARRAIRVCVFADDDGPGRDGAAKLADDLWGVTAEVRVVTLPYCKDIRAWLCGGGTREHVEWCVGDTAQYVPASVRAGVAAVGGRSDGVPLVAPPPSGRAGGVSGVVAPPIGAAGTIGPPGRTTGR
jgi:hypothetical protein